jgi:predicted TIM-barrel fold metal-dependent hydrolase
MESLKKVAPEICAYKVTPHRALYDMKLRFQIMDRYPEVTRVLTLAWPAIEEGANPDQAAKMAEEANDGLAELVQTYPDRFSCRHSRASHETLPSKKWTGQY